MKTFNQISAEQAINHARNEYNPYEWKKQIMLMQKCFNSNFYECDGKVYSIYVNKADGLKYMNEVEYCNSITNAGLIAFYFDGVEIIQIDKVYFPKTKEGYKAMQQFAEGDNELVFASVYFQL
jgi:hypothetical protein